MRRLATLTIVTLLSATGAFAQSSMGVDSTGRFDGTPPLGTSPDYEDSTTIRIPLDRVETGSTGWSSSDRVDWAKCPAVRDANGRKHTSRSCMND